MASITTRHPALVAGLLAAIAIPTSSQAGEQPAATDHSAHQAAGHEGHKMEPWMYEGLRKRVDIYRTASDAYIDNSMVQMGPDYTSYLSAPSVHGKAGVVVLAHGFGKVGDEAFRKGLQPLAANYPFAVSFGMSMTSSAHIQEAIDKLTAAGAGTIVMVPALSSSASDDQLRQWQYMFGLTNDAGYLETTRIVTDRKVVWTPALEDHPLVIDMIADNAREVSKDPANEVVIIVSHGPTLDADNQKNRALLGRIATALKAKDGYSAVKFMSMQNDAVPAVRAANGRELRGMVEDANKAGKRVVIVTNLQSPRSIQQQVEDDIKGTEYVFNTKGLVQHPNYPKWVDTVARAAMAKAAQ